MHVAYEVREAGEEEATNGAGVCRQSRHSGAAEQNSRAEQPSCGTAWQWQNPAARRSGSNGGEIWRKTGGGDGGAG